METIDRLIRDRAEDDHLGLAYRDRTWSHAQVTTAQADRAAVLASLRKPGPFHVALLLENIPEYVFWLGAAALAGAVIVGGNPTHRGDELARDLSHTECQLLITDQRLVELVDGHDLGPALPPDRILVIDDPTGDSSTGDASPTTPYGRLLASVAGSPLPDPSVTGVDEDTLGLLLFTSGTSGAPKACRCTQGRLARIGGIVAQMFGLTADDVCYLVMPLFHSNALMAGWAPALAGGSTAVLRDRFSASQFLSDVRKYGVTYFNYVGKPLSYILATPAQPDDADNPLVRAFGNEAAEIDVARFAERFGCTVQDSYGSTEGGASVTRTPDTPRGALGRALEGTMVLDPDTGQECPRATFDEHGRLTNADQAIGELVSKVDGAGFEGYWRNDEAEAVRLRNGWYWTGDLAYRDENDFFYFAGRDYDWLRVDGENFAAAPVEAILKRNPDVVLASVFAVPDTVVGDQVMAALQLRAGAEFDPDAFGAFLAAEEDLGTKWGPRFVRIAHELPVTATTKVLKRALRTEGWRCADPVWWRPTKDSPYQRLSVEEADALDAAIDAR
ncbi:MAG TPA: AMP-binding protein [Acidimicrobiales bacterium]|nr:AMP-binding protein [Acidimicrobiales bacterium]